MTFSVGGYIWHVQLTWLDIWPNANLACSLMWGVGWTEGQPVHSSNKLGHKMSLLGDGNLVYVTKVVTCMTTKIVFAWERVRLTFCLIGSQPASQLTSCNWPANQLCDKISICQALGWSDGGRGIGSLTTLGPSPGSQHSHWFPLGSYLPDQGQSIDTNELCSPLYTIATTIRDCWQYCIYVTKLHILAQNVEKCHTDYFLSR